MTALQDELEKMKADLAAQEGKENEETESKKSEEESHEKEVKEEEPEEKEEIKEIPKEESKPKIKEEKLDDAGYARLRREATAEKRRAETAEKELAELRRTKETPLDLPSEAPLSPEVQAMVNDHRITRAEREFLALESKAKQEHPEYGMVAAEYASAMYQSFKIQNPRKSDIELNEMTKRAILIKAGEYLNAGYENPAEEMYHEAKELGFTGKSFQKQESKPEEKEEKLQPDLGKVAENRKRSSGMAASSGRSEGQMTIGAAADLTAAEWAKLPTADKRRLMYGQ